MVVFHSGKGSLQRIFLQTNFAQIYNLQKARPIFYTTSAKVTLPPNKGVSFLAIETTCLSTVGGGGHKSTSGVKIRLHTGN